MTQDNGDEIATSDTPKLTAMYCKEEGLEGLQQCYINVHGLCRLPRTHVLGSESEDGKCNSCKHRQHAACPEEAPSTKLLHCQKGQYMLVRLPPHCKVRWKGSERFHKDLRRFHSPESSGFIEVSFQSVETAEYHR